MDYNREELIKKFTKNTCTLNSDLLTKIQKESYLKFKHKYGLSDKDSTQICLKQQNVD